MASIKRFYVGWFSMVMGVAIATLPTTTQAQSIAPDGSLPTTVSPLVDDTYTIGGGLRSDSNLFHSFSEFGLPNGETAEFISGAGILNIISRVTGGNVSTIDGTLRTTIEGTTTGQIADVNLFIINPNGLTFTENARLDIGRSFIGSTAGSLLFEDGTQLETGSATDFSGTASMPVTFEIADGGGPINVVDTGIAGFVAGDDGLEMSLDNTLALIGGDVTLEGAILQAPKGTIHLAALSAGERTILEVSPTSGILTVEDADSEDIPVGSDSILSISDSIVAANLNSGETGLAGIINLQGGSIALDNGTEVQSVVFNEGVGEPGLVRLTTGIDGTVSLDNSATVFTTVEEGGIFDGIVGIISIETGYLKLSNNAQLQALVRGDDPQTPLPAGVGEPGNIFITALQGVEISGARTGISTELLGDGTGLSLSGTGGNFINALLDPTGTTDFFGSILITTNGDVVLDDQASISTTTTSNGNAGAVSIVADNVFVETGSAIFSDASEGATGSAGVVIISVDNDVVVRGSDSTISSAVALDAFAFQVDPNNDDQNGAIFLFARRVGVLNNGVVTVNNQSTGEAGDIIIGADLVALNRAGDFDENGNFIDGISAVASGTARGGNLDIFGNSESNAFFTVLANESNISTSTEFGQGGEIDINVFPEIIAAPSRDSNILTQTQGNNLEATINLSSDLFLRNIAISSQLDSPLSNDISAASGINAGGTVSGGSLENSLLQDPLLLPADLVDPSRLIAQGCAAGDLQAARNIGDLTLTGRDGLSATPEEQLSSSASTSTLATLDDAADDLAQAEAWAAANREQPPEDAAQSAAQSAESDVNETTEAQTWRYGSDGQVVLMAQATRVPSSSVFPGFSCDVF